MSNAKTMPNSRRIAAYARQNGSPHFTPKQARRVRQKSRKRPVELAMGAKRAGE